MEFHLKDGRSITGRIANMNSEQITISQNMFDYTDQARIERDQIVSMEESETSMMPPGLLNNLNDDQIADLVAYLFSANDRNNPVFKK